MREGRPPKYTPERIQEIIELMDKYTKETEIPIFADFCYKNNLIRQYLYEIPDLSDAIKRMLQRKETILEIGALTGELNNTMAIFSLKQMGWTDKQEIKSEHSGNIDSNVKFEIIGIKSNATNTDS